MKIKQISREQGNSSYHLHILVKNWYVRVKSEVGTFLQAW